MRIRLEQFYIFILWFYTILELQNIIEINILVFRNFIFE